MDGGELLYRAAYEGKHAMRRRKIKREEKSTLGVRTILCAGLAALLWALGTLAPQVKCAVKDLLGESQDYRAAFTAAGEALAGNCEAAEVWRALTGETAEVSFVADDSPSFGTLTARKVNVAAPELLTFDTAETVEIPKQESEPLYELFSEKLLPFPEEEGDPDENTPDKVSFEHPVLEFGYACPLQGRITSGFGFRIHPITKKLSFHYGIDIGAPMGTDITAFADGTVELVGADSAYGNYLFLRHSDGILTFYGHCSTIDVAEGQLVRMGETVAKVGSTGLSTGPHLHFEVRSGDKVLDPSCYVELPKA